MCVLYINSYNMNKKLALILTVMMLGLNMFNTISADGILDFLDYAENAQDTNFWYTDSDSLRIRNISNSTIEVESPLIKFGSNTVTSYLFNVSANARANANPEKFWCLYDIENDPNVTINWNTSFRVELDISSLDRSKTYYIYAIPVYPFAWNGRNWLCSASEAKNFIEDGAIWMESTVNWEDPCFNIGDDIYWEGDYCENHSSWRWNSSSTKIDAIKNITHWVDGKNITLRWESYANVNLEIYLWSDNSQKFELIWTVNSERESYTFKATRNWDYTVKLKPIDWNYQDKNYTLHYLDSSSPQVTPVNNNTTVKPVVVWPKENIMLIIFGTLILYIVYRVATRKRD